MLHHSTQQQSKAELTSRRLAALESLFSVSAKLCPKDRDFLDIVEFHDFLLLPGLNRPDQAGAFPQVVPAFSTV